MLKSPPDYADGIARLGATFPAAVSSSFIGIRFRKLQSQVRRMAPDDHAEERLPLPDRPRLSQRLNPGQPVGCGMFLHSEEGVNWLANQTPRPFFNSSDLLKDRVAAIRYEDLCTSQSSQFRKRLTF